jgi:threonine dehydrogenase-like Zn-dependent dehydrogenase
VRCRELKIHGIHCGGGLAEFVSVQAIRAFRVPADLDPRVAALAEPMAVVVHGLRRGGLRAGQRVLVLGAGTVGLLAALAARELGAGEVFVTARHPHQAELASALGAARVLREPEAEPSRLGSLGLELPIDLVVETVGARHTCDSRPAIRPDELNVLGYSSPVAPTAALLGRLVVVNCCPR